MTAVIKASLSLALRLIDTTTGKEVDANPVSFIIDGNRVLPIKKGDGVYVFVNMGREDFDLTIKAAEYDDMTINVIYERLDPRLPMMDVFLMPSERNFRGGQVLEVSGTLSGLEFIEAINLNRPLALFQSFLSKKEVHRMNLLPVRSGGGCMLDQISYALLSEDEKRYDVFTVKEQDAPLRIVLQSQVESEHKLNDKICRIVYGRSSPDGKFSLKVREDASSLPYLIHFGVKGEEYFKEADLVACGKKLDLMDGAIAKKTLITMEEEKDE